MLSCVLQSRRAIQVNIEIMRTSVRLRQILASNKELAKRLDELEKKYDVQLKVVFDAIRQLMAPPEPKRQKKRELENLSVLGILRKQETKGRVYPEPRGPRLPAPYHARFGACRQAGVLPVGELVLWYGMFAPCGRFLGTTGFARGAPLADR
jgi:hypothetical protein